MAVEPLYQAVKPKILLVNFTSADAESLQAKNYHVERGWATTVAHHYPSPGYEYDIVIARFDQEGLDESRTLSQYGTSSDDDYDNLRELLEGAGFALVFTDTDNRTPIYAAGITDVDLLTLDERDTNYSIASNQENVSLMGYNFVLGVLRRERGNIKRPVQVGLSWRQDESQPIYSLAQNAAEQPIAIIGFNRNETWNPTKIAYDRTYLTRFVLLPAVDGSYARITADFLSQLPLWRPELFPSDANYGWLENEIYWSEQMVQEKDRLVQIRESLENSIKVQEEKCLTATREDQWMKQLIVADDSDEFPEGSKLTDATKDALTFLGFSVEHRDKETRDGKRREDLVCKDAEYEALVECKGTVSPNPQESYASQLLSHLVAAKAQTGMLVINHERKRDAFARTLPYQDAPHVLEYEGITIIPTAELFKLIRAVQSGILPRERARALLKVQGRFQYLPEEETTVTKESGDDPLEGTKSGSQN